MTDLSCSKIQCCTSPNSTCVIGQSCVYKDEAHFHIIWRFGESPLPLLVVAFFFIFRANEGEKLYFCDSSSKPFAFRCLFWRENYAVPNPSWSMHKAKLLLSKSFSSASNSGSSSPCAIFFFFFYYDLPRCRALRKPIINVEFKMVARQVVASSGNTSSKIKIWRKILAVLPDL